MELEQIKKIRLLLVDDETYFLNTLAKRLHRRGLAARQANSGAEGLTILDDHPSDVVVTDVKMPGISGIDFLQQIKKRHPKTEVILLTGHSATQDGVEGIRAGAFDYLTKPVEFEHLLGKIIQAYEKIVGEEQKRETAAYKARIEQQMIATERLAALGTLAAGVAHEINNPLAIINESAGYLSQLIKKPELNDMPQKAVFEKTLQKIETSVKRARTITHELLGSVRKSESVLEEIDVGELVRETMELFHKELKDKDISMALETPDALKSIWIDPNQVRQILINLMSNAIHATPAQGQISIQIANISGGISIAVNDTGMGIPKQNLEKIFEPFFSTKEPGEGTGLGLFVTREIVEKIGGSLDVTSQVGHGTQFTIHLLDKSKVRVGHSLDANDLQ